MFFCFFLYLQLDWLNVKSYICNCKYAMADYNFIFVFLFLLLSPGFARFLPEF